MIDKLKDLIKHYAAYTWTQAHENIMMEAIEKLRPYTELAELLILFSNIGTYENCEPIGKLDGMKYLYLTDQNEHTICLRILEINKDVPKM